MSVFGNINTSLIVSIGITIILCGAIVYYYNSRLNNVEMAVARHNQAISSFIANIQNELMCRNGGKNIQQEVESEDLSTIEARNSARTSDNKIVVSDDSSSESDSDESDSDESDNESDNESANKLKIIDKNDNDNGNDNGNDNDNIVNNIKAINLTDIMQLNTNYNNNNEIHHIKLVDIQDLTSMFINDNIYEIEDDESSVNDDIVEENIENIVNTENIENTENTENTINILKEIKVEALDLPKTTEQIPLKHEQMRVDDLRKIVLDKNLITKDEVKKLKKPELLFLLTNTL